MASDRIVLDVGGTKFITAISTLTSNSTYFSSLLSGNWIESNNGDEIFIDQIPSAFTILLDYMRRGSIKVDDISTDVLLLAEFLGIEKLLIAIKVRWYNNIGRGEVLNNDEEIATKFDEVYGGISKAISTGLFPYFLKADELMQRRILLSCSLAQRRRGTTHLTNGQCKLMRSLKSPSLQLNCVVMRVLLER